MIGDDAMARRMFGVGRHAGQIDRGGDQRAEQIDGVIVVGALQHRGDALEPHAGVDRGTRQLDAGAPGKLLILHEHQIPDLDEAVAVLVGAAGRAALKLRPMIVENLGARAARPQIAHRPEIVGAGDADDLRLRHAGDLAPQFRRLVVVGEHGDEQPLGVEGEILGEQLPSEQDRPLLEIIAEREIAEHLEEGVMAGGVADIVEIVMLAAGAHAFLRRGRAQRCGLLLAGEHVLERHHASIGEHQSRVVTRHQRRRRHQLVVILGEEIEKGRADLVGAGVAQAGMTHTLRAGRLGVAGLGAGRFHTRGLGGGGHGGLTGDLMGGTGALGKTLADSRLTPRAARPCP